MREQIIAYGDEMAVWERRESPYFYVLYCMNSIAHLLESMYFLPTFCKGYESILVEMEGSIGSSELNKILGV